MKVEHYYNLLSGGTEKVHLDTDDIELAKLFLADGVGVPQIIGMLRNAGLLLATAAMVVEVAKAIGRGDCRHRPCRGHQEMNTEDIVGLLRRSLEEAEAAATSLPNNLTRDLTNAIVELTAKQSSGVEYVVTETDGGDVTAYFNDPKDAAQAVFYLLVSRGRAVLDVLVYSEEGAKAHGGEDAVERYREDPDASVFERFEFYANCVGRIP